MWARCSKQSVVLVLMSVDVESAGGEGISLVVRMEQTGPEVMPLALPAHLFGAVLKPVRQGHIRMGQVHRIHTSRLGSHGVLLREDQAHNFAEFNVLEEKLDVDGFRGVFGRDIDFILNEVVFGQHAHIRIIHVDADRSSQSDRHGPVARKKGPPDSLPQPLVGLDELRGFDTAVG